ncbi:hypothetical protein COCNU_scaffold004146G000020 [Cocos nucifera]|nr:hypothetical protein [Cocos nucifera]
MMELWVKVVESVAANNVAEDKLERAEDKIAATSLEITLKTIKTSITAFEVGFKECRASIKLFFPDVDITLLELPSG